jgi:predicted 3-demethylubiquinone-9 3-methyltransferase (glyoxalase superfamily)
VSLFANSRIDRVQRNVMDSVSGKAGTVLVVEFTLAGQRFMALNGGTRFEYTHAISFAVDCADQAELVRLWDAPSDGGSVERCGWLKDRYGVSWQIVPRVLGEMLGDPDPAKAQRVMQAMLQMIKLDIAGLKAAYEGGPAS